MRLALSQSPLVSRRLTFALAGVVAAVALASLAAWDGFGQRSEAALEAAPVRPAAPSQPAAATGEPTITLGPSVQRAAGIVARRLTNAPQRKELSAYGTVIDLQRLTDLDNRYENATAQLAIAKAKLAASETAYQRARRLYGANKVISAAQYQTAEAAYLVDRATVAAAQSQLHTLAVTAQQDWGPVLGRAVVGDAPLMQHLIARQLVLVQATLPAGRRLSAAPNGATAQAADGRLVPLDFVSDAPKTDPRLQGLSFYFTAPADSGLLPGMNAVVVVPSGKAVEGALLPQTAVVWQGGQAWAYFRTGADTFARRPIATGWRAPGGYIVTGVPDGAAVVTAGAQMLLSAEFSSQVKGARDAGGRD